MSHMQQLPALILFGIDTAVHHVILPSSTSLVRVHLRLADIVDGGDNMAAQNLEREVSRQHMLKFGSC